MHQHVPLPAFEELVARLTEEVAVHGLGAVGGEPGRIVAGCAPPARVEDRKSTRLNSSHGSISYAVFCLKKKRQERTGLVGGGSFDRGFPARRTTTPGRTVRTPGSA